MQAIRSKRTKLENRVCRELWHRGLRFRRNVADLPGKPDIAVKKRKVVVFIDSCFWHGCPDHGHIPATNSDYWLHKIQRNRTRDRAVNQFYTDRGWRIKRVWEHELRENFSGVIEALVNELTQPCHVERANSSESAT